MPIYEYRCDACGHEEEFIQKMSADPHTVCPACGKPELKKLISAAGFRLKGSGWYETDFKGGNKRNIHGDRESDKPAKKKEETKKESSKPEKAKKKDS